MKLDDFWKKTKLWCPYCGTTNIMKDTHENIESTHVCMRCCMAFLLVGDGVARDGE